MRDVSQWPQLRNAKRNWCFMQLLYCDETNLEERGNDFLIYGGLKIDASKALALSHAVDDLRNQLGVPAEYCLKFNPGPDDFSHQDFISFKEKVLELAKDHEAKLHVYVILHDISTSPDIARRNGIKAVCLNFHKILEDNDPGLVLIDRFDDSGNKIDAHLRDKFNVGLVGLPHTPVMRLTNIVGLHYSAIGQSHVPSIVDVALGSLRFAINAHTRNQEEHIETARKLIGILSPLFWRNPAWEEVPELSV